MRLVLIVPRFPQLSETFIVSKFVGLVDAGWDVHVLCQEEQAAEWANFTRLAGREKLRARVHRQWPWQPRWLVIILWLPVLLWTLLRAPRTTLRYWRANAGRFGLQIVKHFYTDAALIGLSPEIVHFEFGALAVGKTYLKNSLGCHLSISFRGYDLNYVGLDDSDHYRDVWATADAIHVLGRDLWRRALARGCPPDKRHALIPPAIDTCFFSPAAVPGDTAAISEQRPLRILSVGRLEWKRGYEYALESIRMLRAQAVPVEYRIIGAGKFLEPLAFARYEMGLEDIVHFLGGQPHLLVVEAMNWADVFLHPAVSEGFSNAVLEAQAMELPVVCTDADGLAENVADGLSGFVVPRRNPPAMAEKLAILAEDSELRLKMGRAGRARVESCFTLPDQIVAFDHFYREMVADHAD